MIKNIIDERKDKRLKENCQTLEVIWNNGNDMINEECLKIYKKNFKIFRLKVLAFDGFELSEMMRQISLKD